MIDLSEKAARVSDILEQIDKLNERIDFHHTHSKEMSMKTQYEYMRQQFVEELQGLLKDFKLNAVIGLAA
jgi:hypothetical protein